jgi:hypothetical protein
MSGRSSNLDSPRSKLRYRAQRKDFHDSRCLLLRRAKSPFNVAPPTPDHVSCRATFTRDHRPSGTGGHGAVPARVNDATVAMEQRNTLLAQPAEFFHKVFEGRTPTLQEKLFWIEERVRESASWIIYRNNFYLVVIEMTSPLIHACIRRHDGKPCTNWNHLQQIKSELIGPEHEAVELFPAESRLINTTNEYHLWAHPHSGFRFPFGFSLNRVVMDQPVNDPARLMQVA